MSQLKNNYSTEFHNTKTWIQPNIRSTIVK